MTVLTPAPPAAAVRRGPRRLGKRARKIWLIVHIATAGVWIGMDIVMGLLVGTAMLTSDQRTAAVCYQAVELFAVWPLLVSGVLCLASGIVLSVGSKYGLARYWWVFVKLLINIVLCVLVFFLLRPGVSELAEFGRTMSGPQPDGSMLYPPIVSTAALLFATVISVFKPWGRLRKVTS